jgi:hypothetical protein
MSKLNEERDKVIFVVHQQHRLNDGIEWDSPSGNLIKTFSFVNYGQDIVPSSSIF